MVGALIRYLPSSIQSFIRPSTISSLLKISLIFPPRSYRGLLHQKTETWRPFLTFWVISWMTATPQPSPAFLVPRNSKGPSTDFQSGRKGSGLLLVSLIFIFYSIFFFSFGFEVCWSGCRFKPLDGLYSFALLNDLVWTGLSLSLVFIFNLSNLSKLRVEGGNCIPEGFSRFSPWYMFHR